MDRIMKHGRDEREKGNEFVEGKIASDRPGIAEIRWTKNNPRVLFLGSNLLHPVSRLSTMWIQFWSLSTVICTGRKDVRD
jgi:hypothetical protein